MAPTMGLVERLSPLMAIADCEAPEYEAIDGVAENAAAAAPGAPANELPAAPIPFPPTPGTTPPAAAVPYADAAAEEYPCAAAADDM